jgi:pimeloyl-ACP methyl ester carboxylesterase
LVDDLYSASEKFFDYRDRLKNITAKTLVIVGENDWICPAEQSRVIVPGANHSVHLEKNNVVLGAVRELLEDFISLD